MLKSQEVTRYAKNSLWRTIDLTDGKHTPVVLKYGRLVVVHVEVVRCGEDGDDGGEACRAGFAVHAIPIQPSRSIVSEKSTNGRPRHRRREKDVNSPGILSLMSPDNREQPISLEELAGGIVCEKIRTSTNVIMCKRFGARVSIEILGWIGP